LSTHAFADDIKSEVRLKPAEILHPTFRRYKRAVVAHQIEFLSVIDYSIYGL